MIAVREWERAMMSAPFLLFAAGLAAVAGGWRRASLAFWALGLAALLALFRLHATDVLHIGL
jgi:hypothetical protein